MLKELIESRGRLTQERRAGRSKAIVAKTECQRHRLIQLVRRHDRGLAALQEIADGYAHWSAADGDISDLE